MFSRDFLTRIAQEYQLTQEQQDVFLLRFSSDRKSYQQIADILETSVEGIYKRASLIYEKFGIEGDSRGKENRLRIKLREIQSPTTKISSNLEQQQYFNLQQNTPKLQYPPKNFAHSQPTSPELLINAPARLHELSIELEQRGMGYVESALEELTTLLPNAIAQIATQSQRTKLELTIDLLRVISSELENTGAKVLVDRADLLANSGDQNNKINAIEDYSRAILCNPEYAPAHYGRGLARVTIEGVQYSIVDFQKSLRLCLHQNLN